MIVPTNWGNSDNGGVVLYQGVYGPPPENGRTVHCDLYYRVLVSDGGAVERKPILRLSRRWW